MKNNICLVCGQNGGFCRRSDRRAMSCVVRIVFEDLLVVPCYFKDLINDVSDDWLVAETQGNHFYDLSVLRTDSRTVIRGPYWRSLMSHHNIIMHDILMIDLIIPNFDDDGVIIEEVGDVNPAKNIITVFSPNGHVKPRIDIADYRLLELSPCTRATLQKTIFSDFHLISEINMTAVLWELYKEVNMNYEDKFYHVPDLQFYVHQMTVNDFLQGSLMIPKRALRGYNMLATGNALYWHRSMDEPAEGLYSIEDRDDYEFWDGFTNFCEQHGIVTGCVVVVKVEARERCIGLQIENLGN